MPTVTIFADRDDRTVDLADEIAALGAASHIVTVPSGWVGAATRAVVLADSPAGRSAVEGLSTLELPTMQIVIVGSEPPADDMAGWCHTCEDRLHHLTFFELDLTDGSQHARVAESVVAAV